MHIQANDPASMLRLSIDPKGGTMADDPKNDPARKMRNLLGSSANSPIKNLPKKEEPAPAFVPDEDDANVMRTLPHSSPKAAAPAKDRRAGLGPPFWTIASIISLIVNGILIIVL